ncbi:MAG TPA: helix-turn-helix transcriptional regulator [Terriglobales bacterium]|nr:helix-turn-helix transcriptional regulator [Terriglobales bacterium]
MPEVTAALYQVLLALGAGERHGYAILQDIARGGGRMGAATLYRTLEKLLELGWAEEVRAPRGETSRDERRRYYRLTAAGTAAARAQSRRLEQLMRQAAARGWTQWGRA